MSSESGTRSMNAKTDWRLIELEKLRVEAQNWMPQDWRTRDVWEAIDTLAQVLTDVVNRANKGEGHD